MSRIQKIVARGKDEAFGRNTKVHGAPLKDRETVKTNQLNIEYSQTQTLDADKQVLRDKRLVAIDPTDPRSTRFQILRTKILQQMRKKGWNTLGISAPTAGAGKSLISVNLAVSIALEGNQSVLLVDMDLRKPSVHNYFGFQPEVGLHDILDGQNSIVDTLVNPGIERLVVLPGRKSVLNSSEQISTPFVKSMVEEVKNRYQDRIVIFDLPPVLLTDDVLVFLPLVDCSLLVAESGVSTPKELEECISLMADSALLGTILNKTRAQTKHLVY